MSDAERMMPLEDINNLDAVVHELGIEDSFTTPADAVRGLKQKIEQMRAALVEIETMPFSMVNDSESLRHTIRTIQLQASKALR